MKKSNVLASLFVLLLTLSLHSQSLILNTMPNKVIQQGELVDVAINTYGFDSLILLQFGVYWDPQVLQYIGVNGHNLPGVEPEHLNAMYANEGKLRFLWEDKPHYEGYTLDESTPIFTVRFKAIGEPAWSTTVSIAGDTIPTYFPLEFVNAAGVDLAATGELLIEAGTVTIDGVNATKETVTQDFTLFQNNPNPFTTQTNISFYLNQKSQANLSIHDHAGRVVFERNGSFTGGLHTIQVNRDLFSRAGSYFFTLKTENATATRQLVVQ